MEAQRRGVPGLRILIVEDLEDCAESCSMLLQRHGHYVRIARNGWEAIETAQTFRPDVVLLDIGLPGLNGYDVARRLRSDSLSPRPLLVAVTGFGQEEDRHQSAQAGIDLHLVKPIDMEHLQAVLLRVQNAITTTSLNRVAR